MSSGDTDTSRNNVLPATWAPLSPVQWTSKTNHHIPYPMFSKCLNLSINPDLPENTAFSTYFLGNYFSLLQQFLHPWSQRQKIAIIVLTMVSTQTILSLSSGNSSLFLR